MSKIVSMSSGAIDPIAQSKRVFFRANTTTDSLKVGQPVCYDSDSVLDHKDRTSDPTHLGLADDTYEEGAQEFTGRLFVVEEPLTENLMSFAGIVKALGPKAGADGDMIEIWVPNGAVLPCYIDASVTLDATILGIADGEASLVKGGRPIGIAKETIDRDTINGMCWVKVDPAQFLYQSGTAGTSLTGGVINTLQHTFIATSGSQANLMVHTTISGALAAAHNEWGILDYMNVSGTITGNGITRTFLAQLNLSGTINGGAHLAAIHAQLTGAPTLTAGEHMQCLWVDGCITGIDNGGDPSAAIEYSLIKMTNNGGSEDIIGQAFYVYGGYGIDKLFKFDTCINGGGADEHFISNGGDGSAEKGIATTSGWKTVKCDIDGTSYYLILYHTPTEVDMVT